jgi:transcriptional regulator with XRE-family HTH domain
MNTAWIERRNSSPEARRDFEEERLVFNAAEAIAELMERNELTKADLANALGTSRAYVTGLLSGSRNMTLRTLGSVACMLGHRVELNLEPLGEGEFIPDFTHAFRPQSVSASSTAEALVPIGDNESLAA